jgi:hypothetical protein
MKHMWHCANIGFIQMLNWTPPSKIEIQRDNFSAVILIIKSNFKLNLIDITHVESLNAIAVHIV